MKKRVFNRLCVKREREREKKQGESTNGLWIWGNALFNSVRGTNKKGSVLLKSDQYQYQFQQDLP